MRAVVLPAGLNRQKSWSLLFERLKGEGIKRGGWRRKQIHRHLTFSCFCFDEIPSSGDLLSQFFFLVFKTEFLCGTVLTVPVSQNLLCRLG